MLDLITILYSLSGIASIISYIPGIYTLSKDDTGAKAMSLTALLMRWVILVIAILYAGLVINDVRFVYVTAAILSGNTVMSGLTIYKRIRHKNDGKNRP